MGSFGNGQRGNEKMTKEEKAVRTSDNKGCPLVEIGVDIGDKDECVITWTPLPEEYKTEMESEE